VSIGFLAGPGQSQGRNAVESEHYDRVAAVEDDHWWYTNTRTVMENFLAPWLGRDQRILDAGCGPGGNGAWLARHGHVIGADTSVEALRYVRERRPMMQPALSTLTAVPFADESFDVVVDITVLCCIPDDRRAARELARVLRPGGALLLWEPAFEQLRWGHDRGAHVIHRHRQPELVALAEGAGLAVHRATYAYWFLAPAAAAMSAWFRLNPVSPTEAPSDYDRRTLDALFSRLARIERRVLQKRRHTVRDIGHRPRDATGDRLTIG
jgi:SAM-dependent methyltransferase